MKRLRSTIATALIALALLGLAAASLGHGLRALNAYCSDAGGAGDSNVRHIAAPLFVPGAAPVHPLPFAVPFAIDDDDDAWWSDFLCDVRVTDVALAIVAFLLAVIGVWQGLQLRRAASAARDAALAAKESAAVARALVERIERGN